MEAEYSGKHDRSVDILWLSLTLLVILLLAFMLPVVPNDYWWYLRLGQDVLQNRSVPVIETYSYTQAGHSIVHPSWLSALIFWLIYRSGGLTLTFLFRGLLLALAYGILWYMARGEGAGLPLATALTLTAALSSANNWSFRPQLIAYPLFAISLWVLWRWNRGKPGLLWILPLVAILWVNMHGSFAILFLLTGIALVFGHGDRKKLLLWLVLMILATLINPQVYDAWTQVGMMMRDNSIQNFSAEWAPPVNNNWEMYIFFGWLLVFPALVAFSPRRPDRFSWVLYLCLGWMALNSIRYVIWFLFLLVPLTAILLADRLRPWLNQPSKLARPAVNYALSAIILLATVLALPGMRERWWKGPQVPLYVVTPVQATDWLKTHPELPGQMWADMTFSSYLIFALPERPIWIDTRFEVYPPSQWQEYISIGNAAPGWQALLDRDGVNLLFLTWGGQLNLIAALKTSPIWCKQYQDELAIIFVRCVKK